MRIRRNNNKTDEDVTRFEDVDVGQTFTVEDLDDETSVDFEPYVYIRTTECTSIDGLVCNVLCLNDGEHCVFENDERVYCIDEHELVRCEDEEGNDW